MLAVHDAKGLSKPPAATFNEKWTDEPDVVPDTEPRALIPVAVSVIVAVPENDVSVCVSCHDIAPGPDESDAVPDHVPVRFTGVGGGCGVGGGVGEDGVEPPPQADTKTHRRRAGVARRTIACGICMVYNKNWNRMTRLQNAAPSATGLR
jgi:hypothetical protein